MKHGDAHWAHRKIMLGWGDRHRCRNAGAPPAPAPAPPLPPQPPRAPR
jgi:hypothetical protein